MALTAVKQCSEWLCCYVVSFSVALTAVKQCSEWLCCYVVSLKGGMRAVIWTDVFQGLAMLAGMLTVVIKVSSTSPVCYEAY